MKRVLFVLLCFICCSCVFADIIKIGKYTYATGASTNTMYFNYNEDTKSFYLANSDYFSIYLYNLSEEDLQTIRYVARKAIEWSQIAKNNHTEVDKEIPDSTMVVSATRSIGSKIYQQEIELGFKFKSYRLLGNEYRSMLYFWGQPAKKEYINIEFEGQIIEDFVEFANVFDEQHIKWAMEEHKKNKAKTDELFK